MNIAISGNKYHEYWKIGIRMNANNYVTCADSKSYDTLEQCRNAIIAIGDDTLRPVRLVEPMVAELRDGVTTPIAAVEQEGK